MNDTIYYDQTLVIMSFILFLHKFKFLMRRLCIIIRLINNVINQTVNSSHINLIKLI